MSLRDFYAFEQHVVNAFAIRGKPVPHEWYQFPVFYYSNANAIFGSGEAIPYPSYTQELDYELEVACVIGKPGINITSKEAEQYVFGYTLLNDWSARDIQRLEGKVGLGPAKGKDFAASLGPWIVTPDELADRGTGRPGGLLAAWRRAGFWNRGHGLPARAYPWQRPLAPARRHCRAGKTRLYGFLVGRRSGLERVAISTAPRKNADPAE